MRKIAYFIVLATFVANADAADYQYFTGGKWESGNTDMQQFDFGTQLHRFTMVKACYSGTLHTIAITNQGRITMIQTRSKNGHVVDCNTNR